MRYTLEHTHILWGLLFPNVEMPAKELRSYEQALANRPRARIERCMSLHEYIELLSQRLIGWILWFCSTNASEGGCIRALTYIQQLGQISLFHEIFWQDDLTRPVIQAQLVPSHTWTLLRHHFSNMFLPRKNLHGPGHILQFWLAKVLLQCESMLVVVETNIEWCQILKSRRK